jgi:Thoeris protein ThsB, TIR-like domain
MHKVFISYHHANDQGYKEELVRFGEAHDIFLDWSVDTDDINDRLSDETIRQLIRDDYLRESTVTIVLIGQETKGRKHVDWEIYSSMFDGKTNKKSGIIVITLPETRCINFKIAHAGEKEAIYPEITNWTTVSSRAEYERRYPYLSDRLIDNLVKPEAKVSVTNWDKLNVRTLRFMIEAAHADKGQCQYDLSRPMRRADS